MFKQNNSRGFWKTRVNSAPLLIICCKEKWGEKHSSNYDPTITTCLSRHTILHALGCQTGNSVPQCIEMPANISTHLHNFSTAPFPKGATKTLPPHSIKKKNKTLSSLNFSQKKCHTLCKSQIARLTNLQEYGRNKLPWNKQITHYQTHFTTQSILKGSSSRIYRVVSKPF